MRIILVRHGVTDWNLSHRLMGQKDIPLNQRGREQAEALRRKLSKIDFDCCFTSPLSRARETAEIICDDKCEIVCDDNLMERYVRDLEGKIITDWSELENDRTVETDSEILGRAKAFFEMAKRTNYDSILVVGHNGFFKSLRHVILENSGEVDFDAGDMRNCDFEIFEV